MRKLLLLGIAVAFGLGGRATAQAAIVPGSPIRHVVIIFQENHSFDDVFGVLCQERVAGAKRCDGSTTGVLGDGTVIPLGHEADIVPSVGHNGGGQLMAINGGLMNGFQKVSGCAAPENRCYVQYQPSDIPNLSRLARTYAISDRTFETVAAPSWLGHETLVSATPDGFALKPGRNPTAGTAGTVGLGWGCDSLKDVEWVQPQTKSVIRVPSCVPMQNGSGPYKPSPVQWVPTIMDRLDANRISWNIFSGNSKPGIWAICPTFADCQYTAQKAKQLYARDFLPAAAGTLPAVSLVMPTAANSQHNGDSMLQGDNWIQSLVKAVANGPNWSSTAIFITYDDCGCFYDHVAPPPGSSLGIRVPMVIVSPYAKAAFTDSSTASFASMLAFIEHNWQIPALNSVDGTAYDYRNSFNYLQIPVAPARLTPHRVPAWELAYIRAHPFDEDDPT